MKGKLLFHFQKGTSVGNWSREPLFKNPSVCERERQIERESGGNLQSEAHLILRVLMLMRLFEIHTLMGPPWEVYHEGRRCSRGTYPESYATKNTSIRRQTTMAPTVLSASGGDLPSEAHLILRVFKLMRLFEIRVIRLGRFLPLEYVPCTRTSAVEQIFAKSSAVERIWHIQDSQGQIVALAVV